MTSDHYSRQNFWQVPLSNLVQQLDAGSNGLDSAEAAARRLRYGANTLQERRHLSLALRFLGRFRNPLVLILLAAALLRDLQAISPALSLFSPSCC